MHVLHAYILSSVYSQEAREIPLLSPFNRGEFRGTLCPFNKGEFTQALSLLFCIKIFHILE